MLLQNISIFLMINFLFSGSIDLKKTHTIENENAYLSISDPTPVYPADSISNGILNVLVLLPDSKKGFYRGARFDWSGMIGQVYYKNHTYFQEWRGYNETLNYGVRDVHTGTGPCEEFRMPLGYDEVDSKKKFVKIGVGILEKDSAPYFFATRYKFVKYGEWEVTKGGNWMQFTQTLKTDFGYAYKYIKRIELIKNQPKMKIIHQLMNLGEKDIITNTYCHNFIRLDNKFIGKDYYAKYAVDVEPEGKFSALGIFDGNTLKVKENLIDETQVQGAVNTHGKHEITIGNNATKTAVHINSDAPVSTFYMWIWKLAFCAEPIIDIQLAPSESFSWQNYYEFIAP